MGKNFHLPTSARRWAGTTHPAALKTWQQVKHGEDGAGHAFEKLGLRVQVQKEYLAHLALHVQEHNASGQDDEARGLVTREEALRCLAARRGACPARPSPAGREPPARPVSLRALSVALRFHPPTT